MRNATALLLSAALHLAIAGAVWRHAISHTGAATEAYQPFDLNMLAIIAPPEPAPAPEAPPQAESVATESVPEPEPKPEPQPEPEPEPKAEPVKPEPQPVAEKPKPPKEKRKAEKKPKTPAKKKEKANPAPARETTPPPTMPTQPLFAPVAAPAPTAPSATTAAPPARPPSSHPPIGGQKDALKNYHAGLQRALARHKPRNIRDQGTVTIAFTVEANGRFSNIRVSQSSGNPALDNAALATVQKTAQYQPTPGGQAMSFNIPIHFSRR